MSTTKTIEKNVNKRKAILDASLKLFNESCFQYTSTASISQAAGVATGTLFLYFENKDVLVNELYLECKEDYASYMEEGFDEHKTFKDRLRYIWERTLEWKLGNADKIKFMMQFCTSPAITKLTKEKALNRLTLINTTAKEAIANGEVKVSSPELLASVIGNYFHSASLFMLEHRNSKNFKKWADESFDILMKGLQ